MPILRNPPTPLWQVNLGPSVPIGLFNFTDILPEIGILGTPVIDAAKQVLYVVADTLPAGAFSNPVFQLHALSLVDGHEMFGGPVADCGIGAGDRRRQQQRDHRVRCFSAIAKAGPDAG